MKAPQKDKITLEFLSSQSEEVGELRDEQISVLAECKLVIKGPKLYEKSRVGN